MWLTLSLVGSFAPSAQNAGPLLNPCVELSVGNKLHSTRLPVESRGVTVGEGEGASRKRRSSAVAFHGVTERPPYVAEAKPLRCTHWGSGGRPTRRTCVVAPLEEVQELASGASAVGRNGVDPRGRGGANSGGWSEVVRRGGESTVQLAICWSPAIRLKRPLSLVARAGRLTAHVVSRKIDRPAAAVLNLGLGGAEKASDFLFFGDPRLKAAALVASAVSLSLGSAVVVAAAACFLPVMLALSAAAAATFATLAPPALALTWVFACTGPACEQLWRPLLAHGKGVERSHPLSSDFAPSTGSFILRDANLWCVQPARVHMLPITLSDRVKMSP
ncbi:expressed unknown protein [Ectocarpus siliculosus]|uniref:Uncharacterized protein n=1 Tax=Ectocarpus siliculosus TaxID=2880 RepID=D7FN99_ECTSI|nr:expressed unknown protein [Ectocarpus siliculosus]|eukprot:CBJ30156.1 expressed unknown protein [Ectocarpus siliculosus]